MKIKLTITVAVLSSPILLSCKNELNVSVFEALPTGVVAKHAEKDSTFSTVYKGIRLLVDSVFKEKHLYPEYSTLTYSDLIEYNSRSKEEANKISNSKDALDEWHKKFSKDIAKFREDSAYFRKYLEENRFSKYLKFDLTRIFKRESWIGSKYYANILMQPKGEHVIRKVNGYLSIVPKGKEVDTLDNLQYITSAAAFFSYSGYAKKETTIEALEMESTNGKKLSSFFNIPVEILEQKYNVSWHVLELVTEDKYIDVRFEEVPITMIEVFREKGDRYRDYYITEEINKDYKTFYWFVSDKVRETLEMDFEKEMDFFERGYSILYENN